MSSSTTSPSSAGDRAAAGSPSAEPSGPPGDGAAREARPASRILVSDPLVPACIAYLDGQPDVEVDDQPGLGADDLRARIGGYHGLIVRSGTRVTGDIIEAADRLVVIGRAGTGVDNIDVEAATRRGIVVINAPSGNTIAAVEHTLSLMLALARNIPQAACSLQAGEWRRSAFLGFELYNKTLGILGFGRIGREVARRALSFGMRVLAHDPYVDPAQTEVAGVEGAALDELYARSDLITVHMPLLDSTRKMIGDRAFAAMRPGVRIINVARGGIVDEEALLRAIDSGHVAGAAVDVFATEPPGEHPLLSRPQVIATPHLGAATREAQELVAMTVAQHMVEVLRGRPARNAVNLPSVSPEMGERMLPYMMLAERLGALAAQLGDGPIAAVRVRFAGEVAGLATDSIALALYKGLLTPSLGDRVNYVNCHTILKERGIAVTAEHSDDAGDHPSLIQVTLETGEASHTISGNFRRDGTYRLTEIDGHELEATPYGDVIVLCNQDCPGVVGRIGTVIGSHDINIAYLTWGRVEAQSGTALTMINIDSPMPPAGLEELRADPTVVWAKQLRLPSSRRPQSS